MNLLGHWIFGFKVQGLGVRRGRIRARGRRGNGLSILINRSNRGHRSHRRYYRGRLRHYNRGVLNIWGNPISLLGGSPVSFPDLPPLQAFPANVIGANVAREPIGPGVGLWRVFLGWLGTGRISGLTHEVTRIAAEDRPPFQGASAKGAIRGLARRPEICGQPIEEAFVGFGAFEPMCHIRLSGFETPLANRAVVVFLPATSEME